MLGVFDFWNPIARDIKIVFKSKEVTNLVGEPNSGKSNQLLSLKVSTLASGYRGAILTSMLSVCAAST